MCVCEVFRSICVSVQIDVHGETLAGGFMVHALICVRVPDLEALVPKREMARQIRFWGVVLARKFTRRTLDVSGGVHAR